jgi:nitrite reductase/ring-hydroxylating ferredoxin subunit
MADKNHTWHKIAGSLAEMAFSAEGFAEVEVEGKTICITLHNESLYACAPKCPHAGGIMSEGYLDAMGNIVCPVHRYKFSLETGRNVSGEGYHLKTFPVELREDGVFVGIPASGLFSWLK